MPKAAIGTTVLVTTPKGFKEAYRQYVEAGWPALACDPEFGGQGLPLFVNNALFEMLNSANQAWTMYPGLSHGAYECLHAHGTDEQKRRLSVEARFGRVERHHVPDRAALRDRPRHAAHAGRPQAGRQLPDHRHQDLHLERRARSCRQHRPPRARASARRPAGDQGHLAVRGCRNSIRPPTAASARATPSGAGRSNTRWASTATPPA